MPEAASTQRVAGSASVTALPRLADRIGHLHSWRRAGLALLLGLLAAPAMPPLNLVLLLPVSFTGLIWLLDGAGRRQAFLDGWLWGLGFLVPNLSWVALSMFVDLAQFWWMIPLAALGLPAGMSLFPAAAAGLYRSLGGRGVGRIWVFAACWVLSEWLRGHIPFGGFPWALIGYAWSSDSPAALDIVQTTSLFGIYGLSFWTVLVSSLPARLGDPPHPGDSRLRPFLAPILGAALIFAAIFWGAGRLAGGLTGDVPGITLRIVQTDVPNRDDGSDFADHLRAAAVLAQQPGAEAVTAQIWPESAVAYVLNQDPRLLEYIGRLAPPGGVVLTGADLVSFDGHTPSPHNSVAAVSADGKIVASYDKAHLVPFGEYIPMRWLLNFVPAIARQGGFIPGAGPVTLHLPMLPPVAAIVCYEAIFPHNVIDESDRPAWLLNDTNDAWFGHSIGPDQHFAEARIRTVEEGLPLIRAANGGISGVVDAYGRRVKTLPLGEQGVLDVKLPMALPTDTLYGSLGDSPLLLIVSSTLLASISLLFRRGRSRYYHIND
jgi:apolipoprotein N-acyltransferase